MLEEAWMFLQSAQLGWWVRELSLGSTVTQRCGEQKEVVVGTRWRDAPVQLFRFGPHSEESVDDPSAPSSQDKLEVLHVLEGPQEL